MGLLRGLVKGAVVAKVIQVAQRDRGEPLVEVDILELHLTRRTRHQ